MIALLLEIAYRFDVYSKLAVLPGLPMVLINMIAMSAAQLMAVKRIQKGKSGGLIAGIVTLAVAGVFSVWLASLWLPNTPVTLGRYQTQPAAAAFFKNAIIYFLPLGVFFLLVPFYAVCAAELKDLAVINNKPRDVISLTPKFLFIVFWGIVGYSIASTSWLLDNLQTGTYHSLFVYLVFLRFFVYFALALGSVIWYQTTINDAPRPEALWQHL